MRLKCLAILMLAAAVALCAAAPAEEADAYWAGFFDYYYHSAKDCALAGTVSPIDQETAIAQDKYLCPVCADDSRKYSGVDAAVRGGTLVVRVPDAWMASRPASETGDNPDWDTRKFEGSAAAEALAELLHGADYRAALAQADGGLPVARVPDIFPDAGGFMMNRRHIGGAWYLTYRPGADIRKALEKQKKLDVALRFTVYTLTRRGDALTAFGGGLWADEAFTLKPERSKNEVMLKRDATQDGAPQLAVYDDMGACICVLHQQPALQSCLAGASLRIDGVDCGIRMTGYADGEEGIYCCVLTDAEFNALENGATAELAPTDPAAVIDAGFATAFADAAD